MPPGRIYPQKGAFMTYRTHAVKALTAIGAVILMAGCGSSGGSGGSSGGTGGSAGGPVHGGNLTFAAVQDAQSMNATTVFDNNSIWIFEQIFQTLYTVTNSGKGVVPQLATGYKVSADKKTYTFTLRPGVKFSTGKPLTSADVKFSLDQNTKASQGWGFINTAIKSVDAPSPETVVVHLKYPWAPLLADLSIFANGIVPANYGGETEAQFYNHPVGTGPFKWDYWHKGSALRLVRNSLYWEKGKPYLNSITWTDVPNDNTRQLQLKGGQAQIDQFPAWSTVASLKAAQGVNMHLFNSTQTNYMAFNELRKPFQDVHVRRAIPLGIKVKIQQLDPNTENGQTQSLKYDTTLTLWTMDIADPDELATFAVDPKSGAKSFFTTYNNPQVIKDTHAAQRTLSTAQRQQYYNFVQSQSAKDAFMAFLYYSPYPYATTSNVHGFFVTPLGNMHMENVWLSK